MKKKLTNAHIPVDSARIPIAITSVNVMLVGPVMESIAKILMNVLLTHTIVKMELLVEILMVVSHVAVARMVSS